MEVNEKKDWVSPTFEKDLISVIIPLYNRETLIVDTLQSVIAQTYRPIECIIIDDGSIDNSGTVVRNFIENYTGDISFLYKFQENAGPQKARNLGTKLSKGEFIQYIDSDDLIYSDKLSKQVQFLKENQEYDGVFSYWSKGTPEINEIIKIKYAPNCGNIHKFLLSAPIIPFAALLKRNAIYKNGEWDEKLTTNEEIDYHIRFLLNDLKFGFVDYNCGLWREHAGTRLSLDNNFENVLYYYKKIENLLIQNNKWDNDIKQIFSNKILWNVVERNYSNKQVRMKLLLLAYSYHPNILPFRSKKVRLLRTIFGSRAALKYWLSIQTKKIR